MRGFVCLRFMQCFFLWWKEWEPGTTNSFFSNKRRLYFQFEIGVVCGHTTADVYDSIDSGKEIFNYLFIAHSL